MNIRIKQISKEGEVLSDETFDDYYKAQDMLSVYVLEGFDATEEEIKVFIDGKETDWDIRGDIKC